MFNDCLCVRLRAPCLVFVQPLCMHVTKRWFVANISSVFLFVPEKNYSTGGNYDSRFDVGKASGTLIVARPLDAEQKSNYNLTVEATDGTRTVSTQVIETLMKWLEAD